MSAPAPPPATRSRWLDWQPKPQIFSDSPRSEPTKPSEPGFAGFEGAVPAKPPKIEVVPDPVELGRATRVLRLAGVRLMHLGSKPAIGLWSDLDSPAIRAALRTMGSDGLPVRYLDGAGIPACYKLRRVDGEPVPMSVLVEMERNSVEPWKVRDKKLIEMNYTQSEPLECVGARCKRASRQNFAVTARHAE